jgi:hypothetical protein
VKPPERFQARCTFCDDPVDIRPGYGGFQKATGFVPLRTVGGANAIALAERHDVYAHGYCVDGKRLEPKTWDQLELEI